MKFDTDKILGVTAIFIGVASLVTVFYQTELMRRSEEASVLPYLQIGVMSNNEGTSITLGNTGIGPALIEKVLIRYQGREFETHPHDFYIGLTEKNPLELSSDAPIPGRLVPAGYTMQMLGTGPDTDRAFLRELLALFEVAEVPRSWYALSGLEGGDKAVVEITYASVYGDQWIVRSDSLVPEALD